VGQARCLPGIALERLECVVVLAEVSLQARSLVLGPAVELVHLLLEPGSLSSADLVENASRPRRDGSVKASGDVDGRGDLDRGGDVEQPSGLLGGERDTVIAKGCKEQMILDVSTLERR
jgi:hypothetical protein